MKSVMKNLFSNFYATLYIKIHSL